MVRRFGRRQADMKQAEKPGMKKPGMKKLGMKKPGIKHSNIGRSMIRLLAAASAAAFLLTTPVYAGAWSQADGSWRYQKDDGSYARGWMQSTDGKWYYFCTGEEAGDTAGSMQGAGWRVIGPYYYYFNEDGSMYTGWLKQNGKQYYLNTVDNSLKGALFTGWIKRDGKTYFADSNGEIAEGWCQIDGNWYYFYPESGELAYNTVINGFHVNQDGIWER